ncbi:MAG: FHA domain-containing protein [Pseudonocardiales bacterium]
MANLNCIFCQAENQQGDQLCWSCFRKLPAEPGVPPSPFSSPPAPPPSPPVSPPSGTAEPAVLPVPFTAPTACPHCGEDVPDPRNRVCVECHRPLTLAEPVRLSFPGGEVTVDATQAVPLGRDPASSPVAGLFANRDNISRLHATVGVDADGPWVRDENSLNGTYINDVPVPPGSRITLADGDVLRLAADVTATVQRTDHHQGCEEVPAPTAPP